MIFREDADFFRASHIFSTLPSHNFHQFAAGTLRIIPGLASGDRITPVSSRHEVRPFGRGTTLLRGLTNRGYYPLTNWDDPP